MKKARNPHVPDDCPPPQIRLTWLAIASLFSLALVAMRWLLSGVPAYLFLIWNLVLAWAPLLLAGTAVRLRSRRLLLPVAGVWLLFLPNAPYLATDLIHLGHATGLTGALFWYDLVTLLAFTVTGLGLGFASLALMQQIVQAHWGKGPGRRFSFGALALSSVGVYLGRFLRWNSWDVFFHPAGVIGDLGALVSYPLAHRSAWAFIILFTVGLSLSYAWLGQLNPACLEATTLRGSRSRPNQDAK